jgi:LAO/AO transport system kinase
LGTRGTWPPPVLRTVAVTGEGIAATVDAIGTHLAHLRDSGELAARERKIAEARVVKLAQLIVADSLRRPGVSSASLELDRVARRELSPYSCAKTLLERARPGN